MYNTLVKDFRKYAKEHSSKKRAEKEKAYLYSDLKHHGLSTDQIYSFFKQYKKPIQNLSKTDALKLVKQLWKSPYHEERGLAVRVINLHKEKLDISDMTLIEKLMRESKGWAFLDSLIIPLMYEILIKDKKAYSYLKKWIKSDDFWVRRSALLAQLLFFRKGKGGDKQLFFDFAKSQVDEAWIDNIYPNKKSVPKGTNETSQRAKFFIRKAIGWTLREMSQKDPKIVVKFLKENKDRMSGLSYREGARRLPEKYKNQL